MDNSLDKPDRERAELKQLALSCYPTNLKRIYPDIQTETVDALDRLFDLDSEPQIEDYKSVLRGARLGYPRLNIFLKERMSERQWNSWILEAARVFVEMKAEREADAEFRVKQASNRSGENNRSVTPLRAYANSILAKAFAPESPEPDASTPPTTAPERAPATVETSIPDDFGIPETAEDISLEQVIRIAQKWQIGPKEKTIRNRATEFFRRDDGGTDYNENGKRYAFTREAAISFLKDLKRTSSNFP